jgi:hypothetical protein
MDGTHYDVSQRSEAAGFVRNDRLPGVDVLFIIGCMSKTEILEELPKLTKTERQEIRLRLTELDSEDWFEDEEPLSVQEKALLDARLAAYAKGSGRW